MTMTVFGYLILFTADFFTIFFLRFLLSFGWRRYIKQTRQRFIIFPNTSKFVKKYSAARRISNSVLVFFFWSAVKHGLSCLMYYFQIDEQMNIKK